MLRLLLPAVLIAAVPLLPSSREARVLDARSAPYLEDAAVPRPVASVLAELVAQDGVERLRLTVSAIGDEVEALPGLEGVAGVNLRTAEELDRLLRDGELQLVLRNAGRSTPGTLLDVLRQPLPARRVEPGGRFVLGAVTPAAWPVRATFLGPPLPPGAAWSYLEAGGKVRLAVATDVTGGRRRITAVESRGEDQRQQLQAGVAR